MLTSVAGVSETALARTAEPSPLVLRWRPIRVPAAIAVLAGEMSLVPTLLPRRPWVQGIFTGVVMANTYAALLIVTWLVRSLRQRWSVREVAVARTVDRTPTVRRHLPTWTRQLGILALATGFGAAVVAGRGTAVLLAARSDGPPQPILGQLTTAALGLAVAVVLVLAARAGRLAIRLSVRRLIRGRTRTHVVLAVALVAAVSALGADAPSVPSPGARPTADWAAAVESRPQVRSGGAGSFVPWTSLGVKGQEFLASGPTAAAIEAVTGKPAVDPIRVYVGLGSAPTPLARSQLALRELRRTGALHRAVIVLVVPTGSGWVNPAAPSALEYLYGGDVATVAAQYASVPSWLEYLQGLGPARQTSRAPLDTVSAATGELPPAARPRVILYGESLGALAGLSSLSSADARSDAALWVGVPADAPLGDFSDQERVVHADDPVSVWSPRLLLGPTSQWRDSWFPLVSFWQATADLAAAYDIPNGHGHRYAGEFVDAWNTIAPAGGRRAAAPSSSFEAIRQAVGGGDLPSSAAWADYSAGPGSATIRRNEFARSVARSPVAQTGTEAGWFEPMWTTPVPLSATSR